MTVSPPVNRMVLAWLTSFVHPLAPESLIGLGVSGSRTGRTYRFPVAARPEPGGRLRVVVGRPDRKTWWHNLAGPGPEGRPDHPVEICTDGAWEPARAELARDGDDVVVRITRLPGPHHP